MGINKTNDGVGGDTSANGNDPFHYPSSWRDSIVVKRPENVRTKRVVVLLSVDILAFFIIVGIIKRLTDAKEIIALIVAIWWLGARSVLITVKILAFWGKNEGGIRKGIKALKDMFRGD